MKIRDGERFKFGWVVKLAYHLIVGFLMATYSNCRKDYFKILFFPPPSLVLPPLGYVQ